jgi:flagellar M-ring protein FliF
MSTFRERFQNFFAPLSTAQRTMFFGLIVIIMGVIGTLFYWSLKPNYKLLFGSLKTETVQEITTELDERGVSYKLANGGQSVLVKSDRVDELRIELAPMGAPQSDRQGYELFETNSLGMTDFMQQLNSKRALEGELARSINSLEQVETSRVHLVMPERSPFEEAQVTGSASVMLNLKRGKRLKSSQVEGITSLIAGSVEGLNAADVTILDQQGNRLTDGLERDSDYASGNMMMKLDKELESYMTERGQTMLDRVLGPGNSMVRVSVDQNFDKVKRESNTIDPNSRTLISEERNEEITEKEQLEMVPIDEFTPIGDRGETVVTGTDGNERSSRTRNYEVSETREIFEKQPGDIERVTASVLLNYKQTTKVNEDGERVMASEPYSEEEVEKFREVLSLALGLQPERGDGIVIEQVEFWRPEGFGQPGMIQRQTPWPEIFRWGIILLTFLAIGGLIYSIRRQYMRGETGLMLGFPDQKDQEYYWSQGEAQIGDMAGKELEGSTESTEDSDIHVPKLENKERAMEEIQEFVELQPEEAAQVVRVMLVDDDEE